MDNKPCGMINCSWQNVRHDWVRVSMTAPVVAHMASIIQGNMGQDAHIKNQGSYLDNQLMKLFEINL